jgi:DUF1680 family protein
MVERPAAIHVNGRPATAETRRGFAVLRRRWREGDTVTLDLPLNFRTETIDDLHLETVAVMRGPLMYVQLNPPPGPARLARLDGLQPATEAPGVYSTREAGQMSVHAPFYFVREESYTTYFEKS